MTPQSVLASASWWLRNWSTMMTPADETALAKQAYDFWLPHVRLPMHAFAILGDIEGECSFRADIRGDNNTAFGLAQWHATREEIILKHTGIDVKTATFASQLTAMLWEMSSPQSSYAHLLQAINSTSTYWSAVTILVSRYEQSGSQARDIQRRVGLAEGWQAKLGEKA